AVWVVCVVATAAVDASWAKLGVATSAAVVRIGCHHTRIACLLTVVVQGVTDFQGKASQRRARVAVGIDESAAWVASRVGLFPAFVGRKQLHTDPVAQLRQPPRFNLISRLGREVRTRSQRALAAAPMRAEEPERR